MPDTERLDAETIHRNLEALPRWRLCAGGAGIQRSFDMPNLWSGAMLAAAVASVLESSGHRSATLAVSQEWVTVVILNPSASGLTAWEFEVARKLEFGA